MYSAEVGKVENCTATLIPEDHKLPSAWAWLQDAHYVAYRVPGSNTTYNSWILHVSSFILLHEGEQ